MSRVFFTADLHCGHPAVIKYGKRPFDGVEEMDEALVDNWNASVNPGDRVYVVGDFSFHKRDRTIALAGRLAGQKYLIRGNHDRLKDGDYASAGFIWVKDLATVKVDDPDAFDTRQRVELCHYAMRVWNRSHYGAWHCFGHSHNNLRDDPHALSLDVGVDAWSYFPVEYAEIKAKMALKEWRPVDHHVRHHRRKAAGEKS